VAYGATREAWIIGAVRTPVGKQGGALSTVRPDDLGALVLEVLAERTGVPAEEVEDVYFGRQSSGRSWTSFGVGSELKSQAHIHPPRRSGSSPV
jgi:acetyl-CoA acetyltransferase